MNMKKSVLILLAFLLSMIGNAQTLKIFAQDGDDYVYLGKFASPYDSESIFNGYCKYGSEYNSKSIWNEYGKYGNEYHKESPWNEYSSTPPVIVNSENKIVGYFTVNSTKCPRELLPMMEYIKKNFKEAAKDPSKIYEKFFK